MQVKLSVSVLSESYDILVMTPQILVDALASRTDGIESLSRFSLLVFDECHHTFKGHAYNKIMNFYIDEKFSEQSLNLPQVLYSTEFCCYNNTLSFSKHIFIEFFLETL